MNVPIHALIEYLQADSNAANAFGALASAVAAFMTLVISTIAVVISVWGVRAERKFNALSVRPLAEISYVDFEDHVRIKLRNHGIGPMIVIAATVSNGNSAYRSLLEWMPSLPAGRMWTNFSGDISERTVPPNGEIILLELHQYQGEHDFTSCRDAVRLALAPLTVNVEYTDIYGTRMPPHRKALSWFGRHVEPSPSRIQ